MRTFKDKNGTEWGLEVDLDFINRVKAACGINVIDLVMGKAGEGLSEDPERVGQLLWAINEPAAKERSIAPEKFPKLFHGEAIDDAVKALSLAVADFLSPSRRELAMKIIEKGNQVAAAALTKVTAKVDDIDPSALVTKLLLGPSNSPASSASTPAT